MSRSRLEFLLRNGKIAQSRPANTTAVEIYSPPDGTAAVVLHVRISNSTGSAASYQLFSDDDGTTYDETTQLAFTKNVPANDTITDSLDLPISSAGSLAVQTGTGNALTFTAVIAETSFR